MENLQEKIKKLETFLERDPDNLRIVGDLVDSCLRAGNLDQAKVYLAYGLKRSPDNPSLAFQKGMLLLYKNEFQSAVEAFTALLNTDVPQDVVKYNIAWARLALHQPAESLEVLEGADSSQPRTALLKARALHHLGRMDEATELLWVAATHDETALEAESMLAIIALDQESVENARSLANSILGKNPQNVEANLVAGTLSLNDGDLAVADTNFSVALAEKPSSGRGWLGKGLLAMLRRDFAQSTDCLERAVELMPTHLGTYNALAWAYICANDLDKAEEVAQRAKSIEPRFAETQGTLAVISLLKGDKSSASIQSKLANRLSGNSFAGRFSKVLLDSDSGEVLSAESLMGQILNSEINKQGESLVKALTRYQEKIQQEATLNDPEE
ncbi:tetratricopeptide repeat protein [Microbulbifer rhizosphaerae]|uniref:Tetratricopeptide (TPR) repeat protein n=1 Tax=Microbulbifer rhizosphaerae TaxID=1562603 RepID=A0A7W4ZB50_9GAMM|nr:tetratricopeptide repeat protein [Microbulbifer rhizosphaerae]MBB3063478.1 tetratricopeptide (TPR) repeat protein [Microbulbifer rhizosphaerae]